MKKYEEQEKSQADMMWLFAEAEYNVAIRLFVPNFSTMCHYIASSLWQNSTIAESKWSANGESRL